MFVVYRSKETKGAIKTPLLQQIIMLLLLIKIPGLFSNRPESNQRPNQPPSRKPDGEQETNINQINTNVRYHNIGQIYHLERRFLH